MTVLQRVVSRQGSAGPPLRALLGAVAMAAEADGLVVAWTGRHGVHEGIRDVRGVRGTSGVFGALRVTATLEAGVQVAGVDAALRQMIRDGILIESGGLSVAPAQRQVLTSTLRSLGTAGRSDIARVASMWARRSRVEIAAA